MRAIYLFTLAGICSAINLPDECLADSYTLGPGDTLAIIVHGVVGEFGKAPVHFPTDEDSYPAMGWPIEVLRDGNIKLPELQPLSVAGMTVAQTRDKIAEAYFRAKIVNTKNVVMLSLLRKRRIHASVLHVDDRIGHRAEKVELTPDQATVLGALAKAKSFDPNASIKVLDPGRNERADSSSSVLAANAVVQLHSPRVQYYYTGGQIRGGRHVLPNNRQLTVIQAIAAAGGYQNNSLIPPHQVTIVRSHGPSLTIPLQTVLQRSNEFVVSPGDHIIVR